MKQILFLIIGMLIATTSHAEISAWNCPAEIDGQPELIEKQIEKALKENQLEVAAQFASNCATFGSLIDVSLLSGINEAFYAKLKKKLQKAEMQVMNKFLSNCAKRGNKSGGTLGRSEGAHCMLKVYEGFYAGSL